MNEKRLFEKICGVSEDNFVLQTTYLQVKWPVHSVGPIDVLLPFVLHPCKWLIQTLLHVYFTATDCAAFRATIHIIQFHNNVLNLLNWIKGGWWIHVEYPMMWMFILVWKHGSRLIVHSMCTTALMWTWLKFSKWVALIERCDMQQWSALRISLRIAIL